MANPIAALILLLVGPGCQAIAQDPEAFRISVNVDLVVLNLSVRDRAGQSAAGLRQENFEVFEDGVKQAIRLFRDEDIPVTVGLVVDHSGSMRHKLNDVVAAARTFVQASSAEDEMFVVNFSDQVTFGLPAAIRFTNRVDELARAIANTPAAGMTSLYDSLMVARARLQDGSREKKVLIVISDGGDNASQHRLPEVLKLAQQSKVLIYTIGLFDAEDPDRNPRVLRRLAETTGGEAYLPRETPELIAICRRIAHDIRHQYTLGYVSAKQAAPGTYRAIQVIARDDGKQKLLVRTRPGYVTGEDSK